MFGKIAIISYATGPNFLCFNMTPLISNFFFEINVQ